jgi:hypothetical protein
MQIIGAHADNDLSRSSWVSDITRYGNNFHGVTLQLELQISYFRFRFRVTVVVQNQTSCSLLCKLDCADYRFSLVITNVQHKIE